MLYPVRLQLKTNNFCNHILVVVCSNKRFGGEVLLATTLQSHTKAMPGLPSLGEKRWAHPLPLPTISPGAWHQSHGLICHSLSDTSPEYWPRTRQAALGSGTTLIFPTFLRLKRPCASETTDDFRLRN